MCLKIVEIILLRQALRITLDIKDKYHVDCLHTLSAARSNEV